MKEIDKCEEKFNKIMEVLNKLESDIEEFNKVKKYINDIDNYYQSDEFLKDFDDTSINSKYAILSEDGVWNMFEKIDDLQSEFNDIVDEIYDYE